MTSLKQTFGQPYPARQGYPVLPLSTAVWVMTSLKSSPARFSIARHMRKAHIGALLAAILARPRERSMWRNHHASRPNCLARDVLVMRHRHELGDLWRICFGRPSNAASCLGVLPTTARSPRSNKICELVHITVPLLVSCPPSILIESPFCASRGNLRLRLMPRHLACLGTSLEHPEGEMSKNTCRSNISHSFCYPCKRMVR